jgi:apolipoprotein N-acyltransferase
LYRRLTEAHWGSDLIIWPEAAVPAYFHEVADGYLSDLQSEAKHHHSDIILGILTHEFTTGRYFNSALSLGTDIAFYNKRHLVPFGEYFPVPSAVRRWLRLLNLPSEDFTAGQLDQPALSVAGQRVSMTICYEDAFPELIRHDLPQASLLVNISNDGWFGDSIALDQHLQIARMRAMEAGRPLVRVTNTGISAVVGSDGSLRQRLPVDRVETAVVDVQPRHGSTPWVGEGWRWAIIGMMASILVGLFLSRFPRYIGKSAQ